MIFRYWKSYQRSNVSPRHKMAHLYRRIATASRLFSAKRIIEPEFSPDEKLIWIGGPDPEKFFC